MKGAHSTASFCGASTTGSNGRKAAFRQHFQSALRQCLRHRFTLAESFGVVWMEAMELVPLEEAEEAELYAELLEWARQGEVIYRSSPDLFTASRSHTKANPDSWTGTP
jgi:hypothetical protein